MQPVIVFFFRVFAIESTLQKKSMMIIMSMIGALELDVLSDFEALL